MLDPVPRGFRSAETCNGSGRWCISNRQSLDLHSHFKDSTQRSSLSSTISCARHGQWSLGEQSHVYMLGRPSLYTFWTPHTVTNAFQFPSFEKYRGPKSAKFRAIHGSGKRTPPLDCHTKHMMVFVTSSQDEESHRYRTPRCMQNQICIGCSLMTTPFSYPLQTSTACLARIIYIL